MFSHFINVQKKGWGQKEEVLAWMVCSNVSVFVSPGATHVQFS
jgi:hypothetical protein